MSARNEKTGEAEIIEMPKSEKSAPTAAPAAAAAAPMEAAPAPKKRNGRRIVIMRFLTEQPL